MTDVITNLTKLPSIQDLGLTDSNIIEISGNRNIHKTKEGEDNWSQGVINYNFSVPASQGYRWSPDTSYFRADVEVVFQTGPGAYRQALSTDNFALSSNFMNALISNAYVYLGDVAISSITQFVAEASQLRQRLSMSKDWLDTVGRYVYAINSNFQERQNQIISDPAPYTSRKYDELGDGFNYLGTNTVESAAATLVFKPVGGALPDIPWRAGDTISWTADAAIVSATVLSAFVSNGTDHTVVIDRTAPATAAAALTTALVYRLRDNNVPITSLDGKQSIQVLFTPPLGIFNCGSVIPSTNSVRISLFPTSDKSGAIQTLANSPANYDQIKVLVKQCYFYAHMFKDEKNFASGNYFIQCEEINIQNKTLNVSDVGVSDTTHQFVIPSSTMGVACWISSTDVGKSSSSVPPSVFKNKDGSSQNLKSLMLTYANQQKPTQLYTTQFSDNVSQIVQRYYDTAQNAQLASQGGEDFNTWLENGNLYYTSFIRPSTDRSTALTVQIAIDNIPTAVPSQLFCASFYRKLTRVTVSNGMVSDVKSLSV